MGNNQYSFDSTTFLIYLIKNSKKLAIVSFIAAILAAIITLFINNKYYASVIMYPAANVSISSSILDPRYSSSNGSFLSYGLEDESEQLMQILYSNQINNLIIQKYNLFEHYRIDRNSKYPYTKLGNMLKRNITISRTEYMSIKVEVLDENPKIAADIANDIASFVDTVINNSKRDRAILALNIINEELIKVENEIRISEDSLTKIRKLGVNDYAYQTEALYKGYSNALIGNKTDAVNKINKKINLLSEYGTPSIALKENMWHLKSLYASLKEKQMQAKIDASFVIPNKFIIEKASIGEKKVYPKRTIIVLITAISTFLTGLLLLIIIDKLKSIGIFN